MQLSERQLFPSSSRKYPFSVVRTREKHRFAVATGYPSIMLSAYLPAGTFPCSFFTFLPGCYAGEGGAFFITNAG
ncbi:hypothetical protein E0375_21330 [Escherichia coli]|nr:hypothetical protein [Escherichia coli]EFA4512788.1 hypothetical protein [Escherichia coli]EFA4550518.1 hypothetical protein [Escherichia coli]